MTVNTKKITSGPYAGNGIADTFSYGFKVTDKTDLSVYETDDTGVQTELVVDTDYTVNSVGNDSGGTITRIAGALPTNYEWYIRSNYDETQLTAFTSQGAFFPDLHENAMDKLTFLIQQISDGLNRTARLPDSYSGPLPILLPEPEPGDSIKWSVDTQSFVNYTPGNQTTDVADFGSVTSLSFANVTGMQNGVLVGGGSHTFSDGEFCTTGGTVWRVQAGKTKVPLSGGLYAKNITNIFANDFTSFPQAVSFSSDGDTLVLIEPMTHGVLTIQKSLFIMGVLTPDYSASPALTVDAKVVFLGSDYENPTITVNHGASVTYMKLDGSVKTIQGSNEQYVTPSNSFDFLTLFESEELSGFKTITDPRSDIDSITTPQGALLIDSNTSGQFPSGTVNTDFFFVLSVGNQTTLRQILIAYDGGIWVRYLNDFNTWSLWSSPLSMSSKFLSQDVDFNVVITAGVYRLNTSSGTVLNKPDLLADSFTLIVYEDQLSVGGVVYQVAIDLNGLRAYRAQTGGVWKEWKIDTGAILSDVTSGDFDTLTTIGARRIVGALSNKPPQILSTPNGILEVITNITTLFIKQTFTHFQGAYRGVYYRTSVDGGSTWETWEQL